MADLFSFFFSLSLSLSLQKRAATTTTNNQRPGSGQAGAGYLFLTTQLRDGLTAWVPTGHAINEMALFLLALSLLAVLQNKKHHRQYN